MKDTTNEICAEMGPGLFFFVDGNLLLHRCSIKDSEPYGAFLNYPHSHYDIWGKYYENKYQVDFDYYPRGRIVYRKTDDTYLIYYDKCMENNLDALLEHCQDVCYELHYDEHYQCHQCNPDYII